MRHVVLGMVLGAITGVVLGAVARGLMRLLAIGMSMELELNVGATVALVSLFALAAGGAGAARASGLTGWQAVLAVVGASAPLLLMGAAFSTGEIGELLDRDLTLPWRIELLAMSGVVLMVVLVTPYAGWRAAGPAARHVSRRTVGVTTSGH